MAVGRARQNGIEVSGSGVMSGGRFEEHAGSKLHRPNQHTLAPSGKSLQVCSQSQTALPALYICAACGLAARLPLCTLKVAQHTCIRRCRLIPANFHVGHHGRLFR